MSSQGRCLDAIGETAASAGTGSPLSARRIPELDGLRGLAILLVLVWHYGVVRFPPPSPGSFLAVIRPFLQMTWSGVDLFFVLSGFLIGGILLDQRDSPNLLKTFYFRRICRIFPIYYLLVGGILAAAGLGLVRNPGLRYWLCQPTIPWWSYLSFTQNLAMLHAIDLGAPSLGITWSLAIEEQFYLLFPLLVRCVPKQKQVPVLGLCLLAAPACRLACFLICPQPKAVAAGMLLMPSRADALMAGALAAWCIRSRPTWTRLCQHRAWVRAGCSLLLAGTVLVGVLLPGFNSVAMATWGHSALALLYITVLLVPLLNPAGAPAWALRNPLLQRLGRVSYGAYLLHQAVLGLTCALLFPGLAQQAGPPALVASTLLALLFTILIAAALYQCVEKPILRLGHAMKY